MEAEVADETVQRDTGKVSIYHRKGGIGLACGRPSIVNSRALAETGQCYVLSDRQVGKKCEFLMDDGHLAAAVCFGKDVARRTAKDEFATILCRRSCDDTDECRFARTVAAEERVYFAARDRKSTPLSTDVAPYDLVSDRTETMYLLSSVTVVSSVERERRDEAHRKKERHRHGKEGPDSLSTILSLPCRYRAAAAYSPECQSCSS